MTREEAKFILANIERRVCGDELSEALDMAIEALVQEPKMGHCKECKYNEKYKEFAEWVAEEIFDKDFGDYIFFQIACRKLKKFGIVKLIDGDWVLAGSEDKE